VFLEGQAGNYGTPFKFNGKELDEETGLYYYGARYMNPRLSIWYGTDKLQESYYGISSYCYSLGSPNNNIDLDGKLTLFVNGYYNTRNNLITRYMIGNSSGKDYWNPFFIKAAQSFFSDGNVMYVDGRGTYNSSGKDRFNAGYLYAHTLYHSIKSKMKDGERINVVSHSMGSAYSEGIISYLMKQGMEMGTIVHLSPADPSEFSAHAPNTLQMQINNDAVLGYKNFGENSIIEGVNRYGIIKTSDSFFDDLISSHGRTKLDKNIWDYVKSLSEMKMHFLKQKTTYISIGPPNFPNYVPVTYNYYNSINTNGAIFNQVMINGKVYIYDSKDHYKSLE
jgi:RHS repeat-associated protein